MIQELVIRRGDAIFLAKADDRTGKDIDLRFAPGQNVLRVEDNGAGIPPESMEHIFERFYRVDKARSRAAGGAGLGLSIVHDMVERSYGTITVQARPGGGTIFTVRFPHFDLEEDET